MDFAATLFQHANLNMHADSGGPKLMYPYIKKILSISALIRSYICLICMYLMGVIYQPIYGDKKSDKNFLAFKNS